MTGWSRPGTAVVVATIGVVALAQSGSGELDPYWQVRAGRELLGGGPVAGPDTWSYAPVDGLFFPNSPGWNVALALTWDGGGSWAFAALTFALTAACLGLLALLARRCGARPLPTATALVVGSLAAFPVFTVRGVLPALILVLLVLLGADSWARRASRIPAWANAAVSLVALTAVTTIGGWTHTSWATLAVLMEAALALRWLPDRSLSLTTRTALLAGAVGGLAMGILAGPYGWGVWERTVVVASASRGAVTEWASAFGTGPSPLDGPWAVLTALTFLLALTAAVVAWWRDPRIRDVRTALIASTAVLAVTFAIAGLVARRFVPMAAILMVPSVATMFTVAVARLDRRLAERAGSSALRERMGERYWTVIWVALLVLLTPLAAVLAAPHMTPPAADAALALPRQCRVFTTYDDSASVLLLRPDVRTWIDGRSDYWGAERLELARHYFRAEAPDGLVPPGTTCVLLPDAPETANLAPLRDALDASGAWQRLGRFGDRIVWLLGS